MSRPAVALCLVALASSMACAPPPPDPAADARSKAVAAPAESGGTPFTATASCAIPGKASTTEANAVSWRAGPPPPAPCVGEACRMLIMTQVQCTWDGFAIGGQEVTTSLMHGQGYLEGTGGSATGYDWGTLSNGDSYLARWTETLTATSISGTWTVVLGTGSLQGLTGNATITCVPPGQSDTVEVCTFDGTYRLPVP